MNNNSVKIPDLEAMQEMVLQAESKQELFDLIVDWMEQLGGNVTLSQMAAADPHYTKIASKEEWRNVRNNKAGYLPMRRAALVLAQLVNDNSLSG